MKVFTVTGLISILGLESPCYAETLLRLLSLFNKEPNVKRSHCGPESTAGSLTTSFPGENETYQIPTLELTNAENLVRGCNQCLHVAEIPHPSIHIQSSKPDSPRIQLQHTNQDPLNVRNYGDKFTFERVRRYSSRADNKQISSIFHKLVLRRSLAVLGQSVPAAEFRGQDLMTACENILLSKQFCDLRRAYGVGDFVYVLSHNFNHQWTPAIITKLHGGDICDVETGKDT
ncbi:hypothetical protein ACTXT7_015111 [Hymenolepis weldensis]